MPNYVVHVKKCAAKHGITEDQVQQFIFKAAFTDSEGRRQYGFCACPDPTQCTGPDGWARCPNAASAQANLPVPTVCQDKNCKRAECKQARGATTTAQAVELKGMPMAQGVSGGPDLTPPPAEQQQALALPALHHEPAAQHTASNFMSVQALSPQAADSTASLGQLNLPSDKHACGFCDLKDVFGDAQACTCPDF